MAFLLDTCLISEFFKKNSEIEVTEWFRRQIPETLFLSVLTIGELRKGLLRLPPSRKRDLISVWIDEAKIRYDRRILNIDVNTSEVWARLRAQTESIGTPMSMIDSLIAATAVNHGLTVATRNIKDFERCGVATINPWRP